MVYDLHMHSTASDGSDAPEALARLVRQAGLAGFALTDHDTTAGLHAAAHAARALELDFITGIELSAEPISLLPAPPAADQPSPTLHLLGYGIDPAHPDLLDAQRWLAHARAQRNPRLVDNLAALGVAITYDEVLEHARRQGADVITRPHIAQILVQKGYVKSIHAAFTRYIGEGAAAYAAKQRLDPQRAISLIQNAGGAAVLAHPVQLRIEDEAALERLVRSLKEIGLDGIETRHSDHSRKHVENYTALAKKLDLLTTGGSDYHGSRKQLKLGNAHMTAQEVNQLKRRIEQRHQAQVSQ